MTARWKVSATGAVLVLALAMSACGGSSSSTSSPAATTGGVTGSTGGSGATGPSGGSGSTGSGSTGSAAVNVTQNNFVFNPTKVTVKSGATISVQNQNGTTPHTFTVKGTKIDVVNDHGQTSQVKIDLAPGTYEFFCRFHVGLGMKGTLVVT